MPLYEMKRVEAIQFFHTDERLDQIKEFTGESQIMVEAHWDGEAFQNRMVFPVKKDGEIYYYLKCFEGDYLVRSHWEGGFEVMSQRLFEHTYKEVKQ